MNKHFTHTPRTLGTPRLQPLGWSMTLVLACVLGYVGLAHAQGASSLPMQASRSADFIVAVVNSEPITNHEVQ